MCVAIPEFVNGPRNFPRLIVARIPCLEMILNLKVVVILVFLDFNMCISGIIDDSHENDLIFSTIGVRD
jgi:hypothetical protein